ncbi:MAG: PD-(D/E)XK nuclease family protein, partial [Nitrososphaeraceae archaeon]|nr:PD-(D/E)XK nuclease family protein [Nitrososphaeraceae archaeon]
MGIKLSHSAANKYQTCPAMYDLHYNERIRSHKIGSALLFGSALDEALNVLLATKLDNPPEEATDDLERLKQGFDHHLTYQRINKEIEDVRTSHFIEYFGSDFDRDCLTSAELESLSRFIKNAGYIKDPNDPNSGQPEPIGLYDEIAGYIKNGLQIDATDQSYYNYCSWLSLRRKGHLMLEHYKNEIMPKIKRVHSIQKKVELPNDDGDEMIGYIDFEAELHDYPELGIITIDNKTSSKKYKKTDIN